MRFMKSPGSDEERQKERVSLNENAGRVRLDACRQRHAAAVEHAVSPDLASPALTNRRQKPRFRARFDAIPISSRMS
jgi:hypothetical protein